MRIRKADAKQKRWRVNTTQWVAADPELKKTALASSPDKSYQCSDAEAFDVLQAVTPGSVLPILALGIRSATEATQFLNESSLERLKMDNSSLVAEAVQRRIPARSMIDFAITYEDYISSEIFMDAAELNANRDYLSLEDRRNNAGIDLPLMDLIFAGEINVEDINVIGTEALTKCATDSDELFVQLQRLKKNELAYGSVTDMKKIIVDASSGWQDVNQALIIAGMYGTDILDELNSRSGTHFLAVNLAQVFAKTQHTVPQRIAIMRYQEEMYREYFMEDIDAQGVVTLHDNGIGIEEAVTALKTGLSAEQYLAVKNKAVAPSVATGWL